MNHSPARRALVVAFCFPPHAAIGTHRTLRLVNRLVADGWSVDVLSVRPDRYLAGTPVDDKLLDSVSGSVRVVRSGALRGFSKLGRVLRAVRGARRPPATGVSATASATVPPSPAPAVGLKIFLEELVALPDKDVGWLVPAIGAGVRAFWSSPPDVIFSSAPPWTTHLVAGSLASALRRPWVADFRDPWVRSPWTRYTTPTAARLAARLEGWVVRRANAVLFTTAAARDEFAAFYGRVHAQRFHTVYNGCDPTEFPQRQPQTDPSRFVLLHAGTLYGGRSPVPFIRALAALRRRRPDVADTIRVHFLGSTSFPGVDLGQACAELGVADIVEFLPRVDRMRSLAAMQDASALLLLQSGTAMAIPGKLYEYLAARRPVLALCEPGEMGHFIESNRLGVVANANNPGAIEKALEALVVGSERFVPAMPALFDGRLRAAEIAHQLETVAALDAETAASSTAQGVGRPHA